MTGEYESWRPGVVRDSPLAGLRVVDFSGLLPGPLATLMLAQAGADVLKIERPEGDGLRDRPREFGMLNAGKSSLVADLKNDQDRERVWSAVEQADVVVEQFRPGVMTRLGFDFDAVAARRPGVIYCSITGYGQTGARSLVAGHDLNYVGQSGALTLLDTSGAVSAALPPALLADVGGGTYPALINILLALASRTPATPARHLDIAMAENVFPFMYWSLARDVETLGAGTDRLAGGSARYNSYPTRDGRLLLVAALETQFWRRFCEAIALPDGLRDDDVAPAAVIAAVADIVRGQDAADWMMVLTPVDCCCSIAATVDEARRDTAYLERGVGLGTPDKPQLPLPLDPSLLGPALSPPPTLGSSQE